MKFYHAKLKNIAMLVVLGIAIASGTDSCYAAVKADAASATTAKKGQPTLRGDAAHKQRNQAATTRRLSPGPKTTHVDADKKQGDHKTTVKKPLSEGRRTHKSTPAVPRATSQPRGLSFGWPINGKVLKKFSATHNKGIDIAGKKGEQVQAAEAGKVVYGGQGLRGFGKVLIIKHDAWYLTAYANNSKLLAKEGQRVQKGQTIAEVGRVANKRPSLHFEIRKNGKALNPLDLLPTK